MPSIPDIEAQLDLLDRDKISPQMWSRMKGLEPSAKKAIWNNRIQTAQNTLDYLKTQPQGQQPTFQQSTDANFMKTDVASLMISTDLPANFDEGIGKVDGGEYATKIHATNGVDIVDAANGEDIGGAPFDNGSAQEENLNNHWGLAVTLGAKLPNSQLKKTASGAPGTFRLQYPHGHDYFNNRKCSVLKDCPGFDDKGNLKKASIHMVVAPNLKEERDCMDESKFIKETLTMWQNLAKSLSESPNKDVVLTAPGIGVFLDGDEDTKNRFKSISGLCMRLAFKNHPKLANKNFHYPYADDYFLKGYNASVDPKLIHDVVNVNNSLHEVQLLSSKPPETPDGITFRDPSASSTSTSGVDQEIQTLQDKVNKLLSGTGTSKATVERHNKDRNKILVKTHPNDATKLGTKELLDPEKNGTFILNIEELEKKYEISLLQDKVNRLLGGTGKATVKIHNKEENTILVQTSPDDARKLGLKTSDTGYTKGTYVLDDKGKINTQYKELLQKKVNDLLGFAQATVEEDRNHPGQMVVKTSHRNAKKLSITTETKYGTGTYVLNEEAIDNILQPQTPSHGSKHK